MDEAEFRTMCEDHDLTYVYSDDGACYRRGQASLQAIKAAAKELPEGAAARIWNLVVDYKIIEGYRKDWYWKW